MKWRAWLGLAPKELTAKIKYTIAPYAGSCPWMATANVRFSDGTRKYIAEAGFSADEATVSIMQKVEKYVADYKKSGGKQIWREIK